MNYNKPHFCSSKSDDFWSLNYYLKGALSIAALTLNVKSWCTVSAHWAWLSRFFQPPYLIFAATRSLLPESDMTDSGVKKNKKKNWCNRTSHYGKKWSCITPFAGCQIIAQTQHKHVCVFRDIQHVVRSYRHHHMHINLTLTNVCRNTVCWKKNDILLSANHLPVSHPR